MIIKIKLFLVMFIYYFFIKLTISYLKTTKKPVIGFSINHYEFLIFVVTTMLHLDYTYCLNLLTNINQQLVFAHRHD